MHVTTVPNEHAGFIGSPGYIATRLCRDVKTQIPALERALPGLPLKRGCAATMTHHYKHHGAPTSHSAACGGEVQRRQRRKAAAKWVRYLWDSTLA